MESLRDRTMAHPIQRRRSPLAVSSFVGVQKLWTGEMHWAVVLDSKTFNTGSAPKEYSSSDNFNPFPEIYIKFYDNLDR